MGGMRLKHFRIQGAAGDAQEVMMKRTLDCSLRSQPGKKEPSQMLSVNGNIEKETFQKMCIVYSGKVKCYRTIMLRMVAGEVRSQTGEAVRLSHLRLQEKALKAEQKSLKWHGHRQ